MNRLILIKYGELTTKKQNRNLFVNTLYQNIKQILKNYNCIITKNRVRMFITCDEKDIDKIKDKLTNIFGIHSIVICYRVNNNINEISSTALEVAKTFNFKTFKVETNRSNKNFEMNSMEVSSHLGGHLLKNIENDIWECLSKPQKRLHVGTVVSFGDGSLKAEVTELLNDGITHVKLIYDGILMEILANLGTMPLPPYIHEKLDDKDRYQTVYAENYGSAAAPTAGLHFTKELLDSIKEKKVNIVHVTLHVGLGTFRPVNVEDVTKHEMHTETYIIGAEAAKTLNEVRKNGGKIFAVGTTSTRVLESNRKKYDEFTPEVNDTNIFIYPGFEFKGIDNLITNFHLPKSTLIMLVSALAGKEHVLNAYEEAVLNKYRFFSFGDAMLIID